MVVENHINKLVELEKIHLDTDAPVLTSSSEVKDVSNDFNNYYSNDKEFIIQKENKKVC